MKRKVLFKACGKGHIYKVVESPKTDICGGNLYRLIDGRKWIGGMDFVTIGGAICTACNLAAPTDVQLQIKK